MTPSSAPPPRRRFRTAIEILLVLGIIGSMVAIVVRLSTARRMTTAPRFGQPNIQDETIVLPDRPHDIAVLMADPESIERRRSYSWSTNRWGFRGKDVPQKKPDGAYRVAVVGECVAFGNGVNDNQTWPYYLNQLLAKRLGGRSVEVINASSPDRPKVVLDRVNKLVPGFAPDVVMLSPGGEPMDGSAPYVHGKNPQTRFRRFKHSFKQDLRKAIATCRKHGVTPILVTPTFNSFTDPGFHAWLDWTVEVARSENLPLLHTTDLLRKHESHNGLGFERGARRQRVVAYKNGVRRVLLDVAYVGQRYVSPEVFAWLDAHPEISLRMQIDQNHPTPGGHRVIARAMLELLVKHNLL